MLSPSSKDILVVEVDPLATVMLKSASVVVSERVKAISLSSVVFMVLPPLYADCNVIDDAEQRTRLFDESRQMVLPLFVNNPLTISLESESVLNVISFVESGEKDAEPDICVNPVMFSRAPAFVSLDTEFVKSDPSERSRLAA